MPQPPMSVSLSEGQKIESLKRFREQYDEELKKIEAELLTILTQHAEADYLASYLGEQPEVIKLRERAEDAAKLEKRRQHVIKLIDRLDQVIPQQPEAKFNLTGGGPAKPGAGGLRKY
ncbi:hypothetical protein LBMAG53_14280 [Planctomycetota bacterium]|nr:hypothetical protein LBMAG53_14280 [Planctomycetota bacterium]